MAANERRLTTRMLLKWKALAEDRDLPRRSDLAPDSFGIDSPNCLLVALAAELVASRLMYVGESLRGPGWSADRPETIADYAENSLLRLATAKIGAVVAKRAPITFGGTGVRDVTAILYRAILLPLSEDGERIDHVVGAINFKDISAVEEYSNEPAPVAKADPVSSYIAFSSRRLSFAPAVARKTTAITVR